MSDTRKVRMGCNFSMYNINKLEPDFDRKKIFIHFLKTYCFSLNDLHKEFIECDVIKDWTCKCCNKIIFNKMISQDGEIMCKECVKYHTWKE